MKQVLITGLALLTISIQSFAQKFDAEEVEIKFTQLPLFPLPEEASSYGVVFNNAHEAEVLAAEAAYKTEKQEAQDEVNNQHEAVKIINSINGTSKKARVVDKPYLPIVYNETNVIQNFVLNELPKSDNPDVTLNINFSGFTYTKVQGTSTKNEVKSYYYSIQAKHMMSVSLVDREGNVLNEFEVPLCSKVVKSSTKSYSSTSALDAYWSKNKHDVLRPLEKRITTNNMKNAQKEITNQFGISEQTKKIKVAVVRDKKADYSEYEKAYELVFEGAMLYKDDNAMAQSKMKEAIELWEGALKESDVKNKKARINEKVTAATRYNCAIFYTWTNDHSKAKYQLMKLKLLDVGKYNREIKRLESFIDDHKKRYEANVSH